MNGVTHKYGALLAGVTAIDLAYKHVNIGSILATTESLPLDSNILSGLVVLGSAAAIIHGSVAGGRYPDYDQTPGSIPTRGKFGVVLNKVIRGIGASHRSWHTHSIDINLLLFGVPTILLYKQATIIGNPFAIPLLIISAWCLGLTVGALSHVLLDMLNMSGAHLFCFFKKVRLVPGNIGIGKFKPFKGYFRTGSHWENFVRSVLLLLLVIKVIKIATILA